MGRRAPLALLLLTLAVAAGCGGSTTATSASAPTSEGHRAHRRPRVNNNDITGGFIRALLRGGYAVLADALVNLTSVAAEMARLASDSEGHAYHGLTLLAPTDSAMARAGLAYVGGPWRSTSPPLEDVLRSHVLRGLQTAEMVSLAVRWYGAATYLTLRPLFKVTARQAGAGGSIVFFAQGNGGDAANLSDPDVYIYGNISVQGIDALLFPPRHLAEPPHHAIREPRCLGHPMPCPPPPYAAAAPDAADAPSSLPPGADARRSSFTPAVYRPAPVKWSWRRPSPPLVARGHGNLRLEPGSSMLFPRKSLFPGAILPEGTKFAGGGDGGDGGLFPAPRMSTIRAADADAVPFSYDRLDTILRTFGIPRGSKTADQVAATLRTCDAAAAASSPPEEPHAYCATSQQAMAEFAASALGTRPRDLRAVATAVHGKDEPARYIVAGAARIGGGSKAGGAGDLVPCIPMAYPYIVHYCHRPPQVEALRVELTGLGDDDGASVTATAVALCHANTTSWDARYFRALNATRGEEICYFMPLGYVLWLPAAAL